MSCKNVSERSERVSSPNQSFSYGFNLWECDRVLDKKHVRIWTVYYRLPGSAQLLKGDEENRFSCSAETQVSTGGL